MPFEELSILLIIEAELIPFGADWEDVEKMYEEEKKFNRIVRELDRERRKK